MLDNPSNSDMASILAQIEAAHDRLWSSIDARDEGALVEERDAGGWSAKDHLAHLIAWERGALFIVNGHPFVNGLGVTPEVWATGDVDRVNAEIFEASRDRLLVDVLTGLHAVHAELLVSIGGVDDATLESTVSADDVLESGQTMTIRDKIIANTGEHYDQHREWIEALLPEALPEEKMS